jgi:hypothetical protein
MKVNPLTFETVWVKGIENFEANAHSLHPCTQAMAEDELDEEFFTTQTAIPVLYFVKASSCSQPPLSPDKSTQASLIAICLADRDITDDRLWELRSITSKDPTY